MPQSRKRSKGQARKAQKARAASSSQQAEERLCTWRHSPPGQCDHGLPRALPIDHVCYRFKDTFHAAWTAEHPKLKCPTRAAIQAMQVTYQEFPDIWNDTNDANREMIKPYFAFSGTNILLGLHDEGDENRQNQAEAAGALAAAVLLLENYVPAEGMKGRIAKTDKEFMRNKDIIEGCQRLVLRFFSMRTLCACLDKMYSDVKVLPKTAMCGNCRQRKERSALMMCSGCRKFQYCSQQCQAADWPRHKESCRSCRR